MKYLKWFIGVLATLLTMIYVVLFTSIGNDLLKPFIEEEIQKQTKLDSKLRSFSLSLSDFGISLDIDKENSVFIDGNFSVIEQSFNVNYKLELNKLENLEPLTQLPVQGRFHTDGTVDGDMKFIKVEGVSDVAQSKTTYKVELTEFNSTSIIAKVRDAKLVSLLHLGKQNSYASADINLDINFRNIKPHELDGDILLISKGGKIDLKVMKDDFNITLPKTAFSMNMNAKLQGDKINYNYLLRSNLAKISSSGVVTPQSLKTDIRYGVDIRGEFRVNGKVKGDEKKLVVDGKSDFASSDTHFVATLKDFEPATLKATMKNLKMKKVLYLLKQPHYADAIFSLDVDINDARSGNLKGTVISNIKKGLLDSKYLTKAYGFESKMPQTTFKAKTITILDGDIVDTKVDFNSSLVNFDIKRARFNIADSSLVSDYKTQIPSLDKFFFVTQRHMKGGVDIDGQLKQDDNLELTIHTKVVGGRIDAKLYNDDFHADIKSVQTIDALHILIYPELFNSSMDATLDYNLATEKGDFKGYLIDGRFTKNRSLTLIKKYMKVDMYAESFKGRVDAQIDKEHIKTSLSLTSNSSSIKTTDTKLNTKENTIDSKVSIVADNNPVTVKLTGAIDDPKVDVDLETFLKSEAGKALEKEATKLLKSFF